MGATWCWCFVEDQILYPVDLLRMAHPMSNASASCLQLFNLSMLRVPQSMLFIAEIGFDLKWTESHHQNRHYSCQVGWNPKTFLSKTHYLFWIYVISLTILLIITTSSGKDDRVTIMIYGSWPVG
jgi:hypothetical protein